jgi:hypothetical protein
MAILNTQIIEAINAQDLEQVPSKQLVRNFGQGKDFITFKILDEQGNLLLNDPFFTEYTPYNDTPGTKGNSKTTSIDIDYEQVLQDYGYTSGTYTLQFSFYRRILDNEQEAFTISEISTSRREIRIAPKNIPQVDFELAIGVLNNTLVTSPFVRDINLVTQKHSVLILNSVLSRDKTGLLKLYNPLPTNLFPGDSFDILEEIIDPLEVKVRLDKSDEGSTGIDIGPPNFTLSTENIFTVPSSQKTFDQILTNGSVSSSFNRVQNMLSGSAVQIDLEFDNTDTTSGYHFENFIHFSSDTERLQNFKYKLELIETYSSSLAHLNNISGSISASNFILENKSILETKQNRLIQGFDYYERYLYYESGAYAWPKTNNTCPYTNAKTDSAAAVSWFGAPVDDYNSAYYGGQMLSASKFDEWNQYNLVNTVPPHIKDNTQNDKYILFVEMIAQHFDGIWAYMDSITDINEAYSGLKDGISKDLVLNQLTSRGISAYDQFANAPLYEYLIGDDGSGAFEYSPTDGATLISASNCPIPKGDIAKEIWKRLYHNSSYLLKTKGTERGLKALIACYGIPESILHVKEYGGPLVDKTGFRTFSYQKESRMAKLNNSVGNIITDAGDPKFTNTKTLQVRFLPETNYFEPQDIIHCRENLFTPDQSIAIGISQSIDHTKINSASFAHLVIATGSTGDIGKVASALGPIYNGDVWNLSVNITSGSDGTGNNLTAYITNTNSNKNTYVLSCSLDLPNNYYEEGTGRTIRIAPSNVNSGTPDYPLMGKFSGSIQEYRRWGEKLTKSTIVTQSLSPFNYNGNTVSSSFESLLVRVSLGSNNQNLPTTTVTNLNITPKEENRTNNTVSVFGGSLESFFIEETHHLTTPDTVGSGMVSDKVRIDKGTFDDNFLDPFISVETSPQDRQPLDYSDLGVFFSPTFEVNEDIIYTLGGFRLDDYIGDPRDYTSGSYPDLKTIRDIYTQKLDKKLGIGDYIRTIQFFDHTLFKMIKEFVPAKVNLKTGLVIEPHYLERTKIAGTNVDYEQLTEHLINPKGITGSLSSTYEEEYDVVINVPNYILSGSYASATENVAQTLRKSRYFSLR